ncbi:unnamed protein product [Symbiodinium sp. CCMP2592]|nr:unnamed protein product [Symbiodinium sp. CCMP2592]
MPVEVGVGKTETLLLKPSEYQGLNGTAVAGRVVIMTTNTVPIKQRVSPAAAPSKGKGKTKANKEAQQQTSQKTELRLAGSDSVNEVVFIDAWADASDRICERCKVGDLISITGASVLPTPQPWSTSRLPYHLRIKGTVGIQVLVQKLESLPWGQPPAHHPLVSLDSLARVKDKQQVCVAAQVAENPGSTERDVQNQGRQNVCNAVLQQGGTRVRCAFWRGFADQLATREPGTCLLLLQVQVEKKKEGSWELGSLRATQILDCPVELEAKLRGNLKEASECRMLTQVPGRNWKECEAVSSSLSSLVAAIVPGHLRKLSTVFRISGLQIMGLSSVRSDSDDWAHPDATQENRLALRAIFVDSDCQCSMILYHDTIAANVDLGQEFSGRDTPELRTKVLRGFQCALWCAKVKFRENEYQQIMELECRHLEPFLNFHAASSDLLPHMLKLPRCSVGGGCPVAPLREVTRDADLGMLTVHKIDASSVRALVMFNDVDMADDESLQQEMNTTSAMRVKQWVDCCLWGLAPFQTDDAPFRCKIRAAGPSSAVRWLLQGRKGDVFQVVLMQTETDDEYSVLWHVPVQEDAFESVRTYYRYVCAQQQEADELEFETNWTPAKRIKTVRESMPTPSKNSGAWEEQFA